MAEEVVKYDNATLGINNILSGDKSWTSDYTGLLNLDSERTNVEHALKLAPLQKGIDHADKISNDIHTKTRELESSITKTTADLSQMETQEQAIKILVGVVVVAMLIYMFGSFIGVYIHTVAFIVLFGGLIYTMYFRNIA
jgi:hypothetical protein